VLVYTWWSVAYAGEIRQARTWKTLQTMTVSLGIFVLLLTIPTIALYHMVGSHFLASANALSGTSDYPLSTSPVWYSLVGVATGSTALTLFLTFTFLLWFPLLMWLNLAPPLRGFFAWSFDGVLPQKVTYVSPRTHTPLVSLAINAVLSVGFIVWAVYTTSFFTVLADGILMTMIPVLFVSAAAVLLPWHRPAIFRQTPKSNVRILGIPLITVLGVLGFASGSLIVYIFLRYSGLGVHNREQTIAMFLACLPVGFVIYQAAHMLQRQRGVDISLHYAEIPPE
jgi:basic amino acid/polyamine antiporter, APA family